jgi:hypothetical protein
MKTPNSGPNNEISNHCFERHPYDIIAVFDDPAGGKMVESFDAYGERLPDVRDRKMEAPESKSTPLGRIGQYALWALIVAVVLARIFSSSAGSPFEGRAFNEPQSAAIR